MPPDIYSTSQVARSTGLHPNTIRLYETWGLISPVPRAANGYRRFSQVHIDQVRIVRAAHTITWVRGAIRDAGLAMIACAAKEDWAGAQEKARLALQQVRAERAQAEAAADYLEHWAAGAPLDNFSRPLQSSQAARLLETTIDSLRNWERNGLIRVPRDPRNGYRRYGPAEIGRLRVIRTLIHSRYSIMAVLRMLTRLDQGQTENLRAALDAETDREDIFYATDRWLTTLGEMEIHAQKGVELTAEIWQRVA